VSDFLKIGLDEEELSGRFAPIDRPSYPTPEGFPHVLHCDIFKPNISFSYLRLRGEPFGSCLPGPEHPGRYGICGSSEKTLRSRYLRKMKILGIEIFLR